MISEPQTASLFAREQFRMTRLQVYNWGTFSGLHDVPISERGFLFVVDPALVSRRCSMHFRRY